MQKGAEEKQELGKQKAERGPRDYGTTGLLTTRPPGSECRMKQGEMGLRDEGTNAEKLKAES
jgi:hypothetical protein